MPRSGPGRPSRARSNAVAFALLFFAAAVLIALATLQCRSKDFMSHYTAGILVRTSPANLYSLDLQRHVQARFTDGDKFLPWVHPAAEALVFAPLSLLPYRAGFAVWAVLNVCFLGAALYLLRKRFIRLGDAGTYAVAAATGVPILAGFWGGQDHLLTLLLYVIGFLNAEQDHDLVAGVFFGLTLIRFQVTVPVLVLFLVLRRWRVLAGALLAAGALLGASVALVGSSFFQKYWAAGRFLEGLHDAGTTTYMPTIRGLIAILLTPDHHLAAITGAVCGAILVVAAALWARSTVPFQGLFASAVLIALAVDYHGFMYEWSLLLLAGVLLLEQKPQLRWVLFALGAAEVAIMFSQTGLFGLLSPVLVFLGLSLARDPVPSRRLLVAARN